MNGLNGLWTVFKKGTVRSGLNGQPTVYQRSWNGLGNGQERSINGLETVYQRSFERSTNGPKSSEKTVVKKVNSSVRSFRSAPFRAAPRPIVKVEPSPGHPTTELDDWFVLEDPGIFEAELGQAFFWGPDAKVARVVEAGQVVEADARRRNDANLKVMTSMITTWKVF